MAEQVPQGTVADTIAWMGTDPDRAQAVLDAEQAGQQRSTLIAAAEQVADNTPAEADVSEETTTTEEPEVESEAQGMSFDDLEPKAPGASLSPVGADVSAVEVFDPDVDPADVNITAGIDYEAEDVGAFEGEPVTSLQTAGGAGGAVVAVNGTSYLFTASQLGTLARQITRASVATT